MNLLDRIKASMEGKVDTIPFHHPKLARHIFLGQNMYHLIGGMGGTGKSSFVDQNYVLYPHHWSKTVGKQYGISTKIILRSMERSKELRVAKWVCFYMYKQHNIIIDTKALLGLGTTKSVITPDLFKLIKECYDEIEDWLSDIDVIGYPDNPTGVWKQAKEYAQSVGTLYYYKINKDVKIPQMNKNGKIYNITEDKIPRDKKGKPLCTPYQAYYVPDNPNEIKILVIDNVQAAKSESGLSDKQNIDKMSSYLQILRDLYGFMVVMVSQMNRGAEDVMRRVKTEGLPQKSDFAGSDQMYSDADMAAIMFNPYKLNMMQMKGFDVQACTDKTGLNRFRSFHLLKNTYGSDDLIFGYQFIGEMGAFNELKRPDELSVNDYKQIAYPTNKQIISISK